MMAERVTGFIKGLIEKTKSRELEWETFSMFPEKKELIKELESGRASFDCYMNSIRESKSYFLKSGEGHVFLFEIYHGDPDATSPSMDTIDLMVKINTVLPIEDLSTFNEEAQDLLERLKLLIEYNLESRYSYPDVLYDFFDQVLKKKAE